MLIDNLIPLPTRHAISLSAANKHHKTVNHCLTPVTTHCNASVAVVSIKRTLTPQNVSDYAVNTPVVNKTVKNSQSHKYCIGDKDGKE